METNAVTVEIYMEDCQKAKTRTTIGPIYTSLEHTVKGLFKSCQANQMVAAVCIRATKVIEVFC